MQLTAPLLLGFALAHLAGPSLAAPGSECADATYSEARTLGELPDAVRTLLKTDSRGLAELSDRGGRFNFGDVGPGPRRRFTSAAVASNRVLAAVEHGGRGYFVEVWSFKLSNNEWRGSEMGFVGKPPESLSELVGLACRTAG